MHQLTRLGALIEEPERTYLAETDTDGTLRALQAASCTYRIALGPRAGQKVRACKACRARPGPPLQSCVSTRTALASMQRCAGAPISVWNSSSSVAISLGRPGPVIVRGTMSSRNKETWKPADLNKFFTRPLALTPLYQSARPLRGISCGAPPHVVNVTPPFDDRKIHHTPS